MSWTGQVVGTARCPLWCDTGGRAKPGRGRRDPLATVGSDPLATLSNVNQAILSGSFISGTPEAEWTAAGACYEWHSFVTVRQGAEAGHSQGKLKRHHALGKAMRLSVARAGSHG